MTRQEQYAIDQYNMVCRHLKIPRNYDDQGRTLFEEVIHMEKDIMQLDGEVMDHRINGVDELARLEKMCKTLYVLCFDAINHIHSDLVRKSYREDLITITLK